MPMNRYLRPHKQAETHRHLLKNVLFHIPLHPRFWKVTPW